MPVPGPHACLLWLVMRCYMGVNVWAEELSCVRTGTYACMSAHTHTHSCMCMHLARTHTHAHSLKANSSETREGRPLCVQLTEWITCWAKTLASCLTQQHWMAFRWISLNLVQTVSQYLGNGQSLKKNNSQVICGENECLGHFAQQSVTQP